MRKSIIIAFLLYGALGNAQNKKWTLIECLEYALQNNISVKQSELDVEITETEKLTAIGNFIPSLNASSSISLASTTCDAEDDRETRKAKIATITVIPIAMKQVA